MRNKIISTIGLFLGLAIAVYSGWHWLAYLPASIFLSIVFGFAEAMIAGWGEIVQAFWDGVNEDC